MEEIYANVVSDKSFGLRPSINTTGPRSPDRRFHGAVVLCLGLLSVFLLAGLIGLGVHYYDSARRSAAELSSIKANLTERLQASYNKSSSLTEERDRLNVSLTKMTKERDKLTAEPPSIKTNLTERLQTSYNQLSSLTEERDRLNVLLSEMTKERDKLKKTCPAGWRVFGCSCYLLSKQSGSWEKGREDCRKRGADLVVIGSTEEQTFVVEFTRANAWIGLTDRDEEGTWKWIDGTPLTFTNWERKQPDNGGGDPRWGEEDCAHIRPDTTWNDRSCETSMRWICEKTA